MVLLLRKRKRLRVEERRLIDVVVLSVSAPFLLEGDRILSMLTGPDLLRLYR